MKTTSRIILLAALLALSLAPNAAHAQDEPAPVPDQTVAVTPDVWVTPLDPLSDNPGGVRFCGARDPGGNAGSCVDRPPFQPGYASQELWGIGSDPDFPPTSGMGINSGPAADVVLGQTFVLADMGHWNVPMNGNAPSTLSLHGKVTVQPPGADPFNLSLGLGGASSGIHNGVHLRYLETTNVPPCIPEYQISDVPCDDFWQLLGDGGELQQPIVRNVDVDGLRYTLTILGWQDSSGTIAAKWSTQEATITARSIVAKLTVDRKPTTTGLAADTATSTAGDPVTFTATVAPPPSTGGTMAFRNGDATIAGCEEKPVDQATGIATCTTTTLEPGDRSITAAYTGAIGFDGSVSAPLAHIVTPGVPVEPRCGEAPGTHRIGTPGTDFMRGTSAAERFDARGGIDFVQAGAGDDCIDGGAGIDFIDAGAGGDTVQARDRQLDIVSCGKGDDSATVDRFDVVSGCEEVNRG